MISIELARQQAPDLINSGDPGRAIMIMTTPFRLAMLQLHLALYADILRLASSNVETLRTIDEISEDLQRVVTQILQQEFPPS